MRNTRTENSIGNAMLTIMRNKVSLIVVWIAISGIVQDRSQTEAMKASPHTFVVKQYDKEIILKIKGDEDDHWITNQHDFTVVRDYKGKYKFATLSSDKKKLVPSNETVSNSPSKHTKKRDLRLPKKRNKSRDSYNSETNDITLHGKSAVNTTTIFTRHKRCRRRGGGGSSCGTRMDSIPSPGNAASPYERDVYSPTLPEEHHRRVATSKSIGTLKNLVILMKFKDHKNRILPSKEDIMVLMNSDEVDEELAPTGSLKMLYRDYSYGKLTIESEVTDWIILDNTEEYYADGQAGLVDKFHEALRYALDELEARDFAFDDFDADGDQKIDSIAFLTSGYGAEWGSEDSSGAEYENRIWSHKWSISGGWKSTRTGVHVTDYFVSPSLWGTSGKEIGRVGVIAHEIGHYLDLPDLYDTDDSGNGLGFFCMMANSWGSDGSQLNPPELSAWTKIQLGWTTPRTPSIGVENRASRSEGYPTSEAPDQAFKIGDGEFGFPIGEYLLIEFRQSDWLIGGIAIYHVDEQQSNYNTEGYPNQIDGGIRWPYNGNHYKIALSPADENFELEQQINQGNSNDLYSIGQSLLPSKDANGPFPNTDSYQIGVIKRTGVRVCITSDVDGPFMTFLFADGNPTQPWMTRLSENFENGSNNAISFESQAKVVRNKRCRGSKCASIKNNQAYLLVTVETVCLTELQVSFEFISVRLKKGEQIILDYSPTNGDTNDWTLLKAWTKGKGGTNNFRNGKWFLKSENLSLTNMKVANTKSSNILLRFRTTSLPGQRKNIVIDNLKIEGKF